MLEINKIHNMNCFEGTKLLDDDSIDCVITSPPYWALRNYEEHEDQFGLEETAEEYTDVLLTLFDEIHRVLKPTGTCWVNIGDTYAGSGKGIWDKPHNPKESFTFSERPNVTDDVMAKSLTMVPERFAIKMIKTNKWALRNQIIWQKPNVKPENVKDRFTTDYEKFFFFVKDKKYHFTQQTEIGVNGKERNKRTVWTVHTSQYAGAHTAVFPPDLIKMPIRAGCPKDGIVMDPFMGSGTTAEVAKSMGRNYIGFEINEEYIKLAEERLKLHVDDFLEYPVKDA